MKKIIIFISMLFMSGLCIACSTVYPLDHYDLSDTDVFKLEKGIIHFSLQIPSCFKNQKIELRDDLGYTNINFLGPGVDLTDGITDSTYIDIFVHKINSEYTDVQSVVETSVNATESLWIKDYRFIENSKTTINDIPVCQYVYYRNAAWRENPDDPEPEPIPTITRKMFFEQEGMIWIIIIDSNQSIKLEAESILKQLIESLSIID